MATRTKLNKKELSQASRLSEKKGVVVVGAAKKPRGVVTQESAKRIRVKRYKSVDA